MEMFAIPVSDTISEILERMSSLHGFGLDLTQNTKDHLNAIKDKYRGEKLHLSDPKTREWVEQVTDLFYLVDDLCAHIALFQKHSNVMFACKCNITSLLQLKRIEKKELRLKESMKDVEMLPSIDDGDYHYYYKEIIKESSLAKEQGIVRAVVTFTVKDVEHAKHVCEDEEVKSKFDVVKYIGSVELQKDSYAKFVIHELEEEEKKKKQERGEGKRKGFLVVLDYYVKENPKEWLKLAEKLKKMAGTSGGSVVLLVITNKLSVARLVESSFEATRFWFDWLSPSETTFTITWRLFEKIVGAIESLLDDPDSVVSEATEIVAKVVRSLKPRSEDDIDKCKDYFLQEMWLKCCNADDLSNWRLRQCFAYSLFIFSLYEYVKAEMLVRLWMAQGFLGHSCSSSEQELEDLGRDFIKKLKDESLVFEWNDGDLGIFSTTSDLAKVMVGNKGGVLLDEKNKSRINSDHVSLSSKLDSLKGISRSFLESNKNVRTFHLEEKRTRPPNQVMLSWFACDAIFSAFKRLRVLILKRLGIKVLPDSIGGLKSLRYLDLSHNNFKKLNISIGELRYLQTLILSHCLKLKELPNGVNHFVSLRHLDVDHCPHLMQMPSALKKLTCLQSLPHFVASSRNGLEELTNLNHIKGDLTISYLERFKFTGLSHSGRAYLKEKHLLESLTLRWNHDSEEKHCSDNNQYHLMLKHLEPQPNLKRLSVVGYPGKQFADWFSFLNNLVEISFYSCPSLEFIVDKHSEVRLKLEKVKISNCPNLTTWWNWSSPNTLFTDISELVIENCPKLVRMPLFPEICDKLVLDSSNMEPLLNTLRTQQDSSPPLSKLQHLTLINLDEKQYPVEEELLKNFTSLSTLDISNCRDLESIKGWEHLTSLESLHISNCTNIYITSEKWKCMERVSDLVIKGVQNLESLPGIEHLACLENVEIRNCPKLRTLPQHLNTDLFSYIVIENCPELASLRLTGFWRLYIINCPKLETPESSEAKSDYDFNSVFKSMGG